jgi:RNA polymerase sigma factor (sigma-70 family)
MLSDGELLQQYVDRSDQDAFTALVQRHLNVVYRTALRRVGGNAHAADDVTQRVFTALARKAPQLRSHASLAGWLYTSTRYASAELVRGEQRRRRHEEEAHTMNELTSEQISAQQLEPLLDEIMERLPARDREAVLLHFFERRSFVDIASTFSSSADATRMRVNRALDRMRAELTKRGIVSTGAALAAALANQSAVAGTAPAAANVATLAVAQAGAAPAAASWFTQLIHAAKTSPLAWGTGGAAALALIVLGVHAAWPIATVPPNDTSPAAAPTASDGTARATTVIEPEAATAAASAPEAPPVSATSAVPREVASTDPSFSALSPEERNILAILWHDFDPVMPGRRTVLSIGDRAPNIAGVGPLVARGWIKFGPNQRPGVTGVFLSSPGVAYCRRNAAEIEAYTPFRKVR